MLANVHSRALRTITAGALLALTAMPVAAQSPSVAPAASPGASAAPLVFPFDDASAMPTVPMPGGAITSPEAVGWDHVTVWPDGRTLTVYFWNGAEACYGLDRIELVDTGAGLQVTPYVGFRADAANKRCIAVMQLYATIVELPEPILGGGLPGAGGIPTTDPGEPILPDAQLSIMEPQPWERVTIGADGVTGAVHFTGGVAACFGLGRVDAPVQDGLQSIVLYTGPILDADGAQQACIALAVAYWTPVTLPAPLLLGGTAVAA